MHPSYKGSKVDALRRHHSLSSCLCSVQLGGSSAIAAPCQLVTKVDVRLVRRRRTSHPTITSERIPVAVAIGNITADALGMPGFYPTGGAIGCSIPAIDRA